MDESLQALEQRLEQLLPKGLSDDARERLEDQIDELAAGVEDAAPARRWRWGIGAAAAVAVGMVAFPHLPSVSAPRVADRDPVPAAAPPAPRMQDEDDLMELLTLSLSRSVQARTDRGLVVEAGADTPHRYWSYEVTNEEELMDKQSGYAVRVVSRHEEWVPVAVTQF